MLRDLRLWIEREDDGSRSGLPIVPEICVDGGVRAGAIATLVDVAAAEGALQAARPDWVATSDLVLDLSRPATRESVTARPALLRRGRSTLVVEVELSDAAGPVGLATLNFTVLPARTEVQRMGVGAPEARTEFALPDSGLDQPFSERIGARLLEAESGLLEIPFSPYVTNSMGALQGGAAATLVSLAAEAACGASTGRKGVTRDLAIHYLALGRRGPVRSHARVLRQDADGALLRVELHDAGAEERLIAVATANVGSLR
jgi:uncharacterized protein (TIGR00369 family)